ncbi:hypothetical protein SAMN05216207_103324 [Pseudonocardia ammonioxydans]|uniref:Uncharacterized protein n=1 Tax=Pseudonocardia ammonioxydans TaxID=260086 RepID=A0A1I5EVE6_PSUAM|nr:hypothetical protein [Pseudonocardia ammonioxydans]SFO15383.1 hypothetical protein SAMN05216207_103324 [Pseudonocardia ammonioxydans]
MRPGFAAVSPASLKEVAVLEQRSHSEVLHGVDRHADGGGLLGCGQSPWVGAARPAAGTEVAVLRVVVE